MQIGNLAGVAQKGINIAKGVLSSVPQSQGTQIAQNVLSSIQQNLA